MQRLVEGVQRFQANVFSAQRHLFESLAEKIPGTRQGRLILDIARADVPAAENLIAGVQLVPAS